MYVSLVCTYLCYRLTGSERMGTSSFTRKNKLAFQCTYSGFYFFLQYTWIPFLGHSDNVCWGLKIFINSICLKWYLWHAVSLYVDEHLKKKLLWRAFFFCQGFYLPLLLYQLYWFVCCTEVSCIRIIFWEKGGYMRVCVHIGI